MVDKSIDNTTKMATKSTQYQRQIKDQPAKKDDILKLNLWPKRKKHAKTDLSFSPDSVVSFCVNNSQQNQEKEDQITDEEEEVDNIEKDHNFEPRDEDDISQSGKLKRKLMERLVMIRNNTLFIGRA